ncbi:AAA family ATPase [Rhizobium sp. BT-175]|uniref:AAA family ATPase n=1 Tax=Rhizobium sp. BT-175 TaxID=2986929 RepID=UPI0022365D29|nr:AAA family ATPase [Rhizobium sp. BT-175]MCV9947595.1 AAA family ATPase [Rhizobium sp. BT-175]
MATLHLICGLPGSGKSTLARRLEEEGAGLRLSPDDWMLSLGFQLYDEAARSRIEQLQWALAQRLLANGASVILENGFWSRQERDTYRSVAVSLGAHARLHYLDVPIDELEHRIVARNQTAPAEALVDPHDLIAWSKTFEPPTEDELTVEASSPSGAEPDLEEARHCLLSTALDFFRSDPSVAGVFLGGSLAAGSADVWSDIDLRVVVTSESHARFIEQRKEIPKRWPGFLFNEWVPGAQHCVSHFRPFGKIDIFYYDVAALRPSPWYRLPIEILYDPKGIVADLVAQSKGLQFQVSEEEIDFSISKGLAAAHEAFRRARRGELFYAQTLLNELRQHIMQADDWLHDRTPETAVIAKFEKRASQNVVAALKTSYCLLEAGSILVALRSLVALYRGQVLTLHEKFRISRPVENDTAALDVVGQRSLPAAD